MRKSMRAAVSLAAAAMMLASACMDATRPSTPTLLRAVPVSRTAALTREIRWSFVAGPGGATSSNSAVGLTIAIPAGALSSTQTITVTALQGATTAYKFEPHGLQFSRSVVLTQNLQGTSAASEPLPLLQGAYFATDRLTVSEGQAVVTERLSGLVNPVTRTFSFNIRHFSGYIVASGVGDGS